MGDLREAKPAVSTFGAHADDPGNVMGGEWIEIEKGNNEEKKRLSPLREFNLAQIEFPVKSIS